MNSSSPPVCTSKYLTRQKLGDEFCTAKYNYVPLRLSPTKHYNAATRLLLCHSPTPPNIAPATQKESHDWSASHMKPHLQCTAASRVILQLHQILCLPLKMNLMIDPRHIWSLIYSARSNKKSPFKLTKYCACHEILGFKIWARNPC